MVEKYISKDPNQTTAHEICRIAELEEFFNGDSPSDVHQFNINSECEVKRK